MHRTRQMADELMRATRAGFEVGLREDWQRVPCPYSPERADLRAAWTKGLDQARIVTYDLGMSRLAGTMSWGR